MRHRQTGRLARRPAARAYGKRRRAPSPARQRLPRRGYASSRAASSRRKGRCRCHAGPSAWECVGHGQGCAGPAEWVKDDSRRGRRSGLRAGAGALSGDAVGQPCSRPGTCHSPAGQHLEAGRKSALEGRRCSAWKLRTGAGGCRRVSQIRVTERATWRAVDHSCPTVGAAVECHRRVLGRSARTLNGLAERP
jgi:hypothetical protein